MFKVKTKFIQLIFSSLLLFFGCHDPIQPPSVEIHPKIIRLQSYNDSVHNIGGNFWMGLQSSNKIFCVSPLKMLTVDNNLNIIGDSILALFGGYRFVSINKTGTKLLLVRSLYPDAIIGSLYEFDLLSGTQTLLKDSSFSISSALFLNMDQKCIYYSYGNSSKSYSAGYYSLDVPSGKDSLILAHASPVGFYEITNGFDISPDNKKLLFPLHYLSSPPKLVEFDFISGVKETLNINFEKQFLWVRYNSIGSKIVYSNYPWGSAGDGSSAGDTSEIGIINRATLSKVVLGVNTQRFEPGLPSINIFPSWAPNGKDIIYGSAPGPAVEPPGAVGAYSLYALQNANLTCPPKSDPSCILVY